MFDFAWEESRALRRSNSHHFALKALLVGLLTAVLLVAHISTSHAQSLPVAAYSFDEGSGGMVKDSVGNHDGTISGATWASVGKYGFALDFDGVNDLVSIADAADLDFTDAFTLEAWVRPDTATAGPTVTKGESSGGTSGYALSASYMGYPTGQATASGAIKSVAAPTALPTGAWSHLVFASDGTTLHLYVDGKQVATREAIATKATAAKLEIGRSQILGTYFDGLIDEVRLYDEALDQEQIEADRDTAVSIDQIAVAAYSFSEGSGTSTADSIGGHDGMIEGATWTTSGKYGSALDFDGTNDFVSIADATNLDLTKSFTLEAWLRPDMLFEWSTALAKAENIGGKPAGYWLAANAYTGPSGSIADGSGEVRGVYDVVNALPVGAWSHLAVTYDGTILRIYVNGSHKNSSTPPIGVVATAANLTLGNNPIAGTYYDGRIDEVSLYDEALSAGQIYDTAITSGPIGSITSTSAVFQFEGRASTASFECSIDGGSYSSCASGKIYSGLGEGSHVFRVRATNGGSTKDESPAERRFVVDTVAPQTNIDSSKPAYVEDPPPALEFSSNESGATFACSLDGSSFPCESPYQLPTMNHGPHVFTAKATDLAGQVDASPASWEFEYDPSVPAPVAAYSFDEGSGAMVRDSARSHDGTIEGATWTTSGKYGSALDFDGTSDWVSIADAADLDLTNSFTLEAWVQPDTTANWRPVISKTESSEGHSGYLLLSRGSGPEGNPTGYVASSGSVKNVAGASALAVESWSHLAFTSDGSTLRLYVDGELVASGEAIAAKPTAASLRIGHSPLLATYFDGRIDEVRLYDEELSQEDVEVDRSRPIGLEQIPIAAYSFDEGAGAKLHDVAANHDGTIEGATWATGGKTGSALAFDGVNDFVSIPDANELDLTGSFTLAAWVRPDTVTAGPTVTKGESSGGISGYALNARYMGYPTGHATSSGSIKSVIAPSALPTEAWSHIAFTSDGTTLKYFVNGQLVATASGIQAKATAAKMVIGHSQIFNTYFDGLIDDVRIYDEILSAGEISTVAGIPWSSVADSDVDGDGRADLVAIDSQGTTRVFRGTENGITVASGVTSLVVSLDPALYDGNGHYAVDAADVTGDARADLVTLRSDGQVYSHLGRSNGTFGLPILAGPSALPIMNDHGDYEPIAVADVNGDGRGDLIGVDHSASDIVVFPGKADGTFSSAVTDKAGFDSALLDDVGHYALDVIDVSGDGRADLVTIYTDGKKEGAEEVLKVYSGQVSGEFGAPMSSQAVDPIMDDGSGEEPVGLGDVDKDGKADLVTLAGTTLKFRAGKADGTFAAAANAYSSSINSSLLDGTGEELIGLLDYTRDGRGDLVSSEDDGDILIYTAQSGATFAAPATHPGPLRSSRFDLGGHEFAYEKPFMRRAVDPLAPKLTATGPLVESADGPLGVQAAKVNVSATDGTATGSSGVTKVQMFVDGNLDSTYNVPCSPTCEEPATASFTFSKATWGAGPHNVEIQAIDRVGKKATTAMAVDVPDGPSVILDGPLYTRRGKTVGTAAHQLSITASQNDGNSEAPRPGVKSIEVRVDGTSEASPPEQECQAGNCSMSRTWNFNPAGYPSGAHAIEVFAKDQQGNTTKKQFQVTADTSDPCADSAVIPSESCPAVTYDVVHAWVYTGDPVASGKLLAEEWIQTGTKNARRIDEYEVITTRGTVTCEASQQGCGEVRSAPTAVSGTGNKYVVTTGTSVDDPALSHVATLRQPTTESLGTAVGSGPLGDVLKHWQDAPPSHGSTYELYETESKAEGGTTYRGRWWLDTETDLPVRYTMVSDSSSAGGPIDYGHYFITYDQVLKQAKDLPTNFFLLPQPDPAETLIKESAEEGATPGLE